MPTYDTNRIELGFVRTECGCPKCSVHCRAIPGFLIPSDIDRMYKATSGPGESVQEWARRTLLASDGAKAIDRRTGTAVQIRTLVPAAGPDGACGHITPEGRCGVHAVAPYGCAFADSHQPEAVGVKVAMVGLRAVLDAQADPTSLYHGLWAMLNAEGRVPPPLAARRQRLLELMRQVDRDDA